MGKLLGFIVAIVLAGRLLVAAAPTVGTDTADRATALRSSAPDAGLIAVAGPAPGRIRLLYARNGTMVLVREIAVPDGAEVRELALSADGRDLFVSAGGSAYTLSTRTGRVEARDAPPLAAHTSSAGVA